MVDVNNYNHIKLAPKVLIESTEFMMKCLKTITKHCGGIHWSKLEFEFQKATKGVFQISDFFEYNKDQIKEFLCLHPNHFKISCGGFVEAIDNKLVIKK